MEFLSTLDIDGISEHTQLFSLSHEQVNMVVKDTITNTVKQLKAFSEYFTSFFVQTNTELSV